MVFFRHLNSQILMAGHTYKLSLTIALALYHHCYIQPGQSSGSSIVHPSVQLSERRPNLEEPGVLRKPS
ncbi:hypothetical protein H9L39_12376 [Fusarium oxysporum f. sp. albedinis]|nr:hypothetical protein H9L39_12376 [Fusarium oxysporum f. sp. albedinis]